MANVSATRLEEDLWPRGFRRDVWMVVDAARDQRIYGMLLESRLEFSCLYSGLIPPALETLAPYLVQLEHEDRRCRKLLEHAWGRNWGIFLKCDTRLEKLRKHLRGFLTVRDPAGAKLLFRYYDPRVLRVYLPTCSSDDLRAVFGPIERFWAEGETGDTICEFALAGNKLAKDEFSLKTSATRPMISQPAPSVSFAPARPRSGLMAMRIEQMAAFSQAEIHKFERWMTEHLAKFFPREVKALGEINLLETIRYGIRQAAAYEVRTKRDVCKYIDVMVVLGRDFDKDKRYAWAARMLKSGMSQGVKMHSVLAAAKRSVANR